MFSMSRCNSRNHGPEIARREKAEMPLSAGQSSCPFPEASRCIAVGLMVGA